MDSEIILAPRVYELQDYDPTMLFSFVELEPKMRDPDDRLSAFSLISLQMMILLIINQIIFICLTIRAFGTLDRDDIED